MSKPSSTDLELLIRERNKGKSLRQLGQMFGISHEMVRQILAKHGPVRVELFPESSVAARLGYPIGWLVRLREAGITNPTKPGGRWLYSEEQVKQIPSIIAQMWKRLPKDSEGLYRAID
jgi:transcriptional regulator with XRE-family HTH domain